MSRAVSESPFELAIVGGGATGLAAAIQAASDGLRVVLLERGSPGGRVREHARVEVVPGLPVGPSGAHFTRQAVSTAIRLGVEIRSGSEALGLDIHGDLKRLRLADGRAVDARSVIVATGAEYPVLPTRGVREFTGRGVHFGLPTTLPANLPGREAFVTGEPGAVAAAALRLSSRCGGVTMVSDGPGASAGVDAALRRRLRARPDIVEAPHHRIVEVVGVERVEALILRDLRSGRMSVRNAAALFVLGTDLPRTAWLAGALALDPRGYVLTGAAARGSGAGECSDRPGFAHEASRPGVFAAGGARGTRDCRIESRGGEGVRAAREAFRYLREIAI